MQHICCNICYNTVEIYKFVCICVLLSIWRTNFPGQWSSSTVLCKTALMFWKDINEHYTLTLFRKYTSYTICIYVIASWKSLLSARIIPLYRWNIIFNISRVSLREFEPLINFVPPSTVLNGNCQTSASNPRKITACSRDVDFRRRENKQKSGDLSWSAFNAYLAELPVASNNSKLIPSHRCCAIVNIHHSANWLRVEK